MIDLRCGDCLQVMATMPDNSVDAIVTDPPYGLSFMGKKWDYDVPSVEIWRECLRVLKPGGHLLSFAGTRTQHRMAVNIEDAGFEIRDMIMWCYGSGFPKSLDVSKAIDKAAGAEREVVGQFETKDIRRNVAADIAAGKTDRQGKFAPGSPSQTMTYNITAPATDAAKQWAGFGTALKPALEPITVARKPLMGTVAENVLAHGTGALNIDGCRVVHNEECRMMAPSKANIDSPSEKCRQAGRRESTLELKPSGRWPANFIHDGSDEVVGLFPQSNGMSGGGIRKVQSNIMPSIQCKGESSNQHLCRNDSGSAARFFYCAKASRREREGSTHPTMKPVALMQYLVRLVTPPDGIVLDPFMGSGSTGKAAIREGFRFIGIERDAEYFEIAKARIDYADNQATAWAEKVGA